MKRKIIAYIMSLTIIFTVLSTNYCYAAGETEVLKTVLVDGAALGAGALSGGLALLAVLGVGVLTSDGGQKAVVDMYNYCDDVNKKAIADMHGDYAVVSDELYNQAKAFVDSVYSVGQSLKRNIDFAINSSGNVVFSSSTDCPLSFVTNRNTYLEWDRSKSILSVHVPSIFFDSGLYVKEIKECGSGPYTMTYNSYFCDKGYYFVTFFIYNRLGTYFTSAQASSYCGNYDPVIGVAEDDYYTYTRSGVAIPLPQTTAGDKVIAIPQAIPYTGGIGLTGDMCIPDALTIADAEAGTTDPPTEPPESNKINWRPLKTSGVLFTTKFPFSLPWDLLKTFKALLIDDPDPPVWDIKWHDEILNKDLGFKLDLTRFDTIFKVARVFVLLALIVGLIMSTRKLLGGAT